MKKDIFFSDNLTFEVNVIGYREEGESILFLLRADGNVVYSGLVDCFQDDIQNESISILKKAGRSYFDFVCWTHPHDDHTVGMENIVRNYCNDKTCFWMPPFKSYDTCNFALSVQNTYNELFSSIKSRQKNKMKVDVAFNGMRLSTFLCRKADGFNNVRFSIFSFAPVGGLIISNAVRDVNEVGNLYSIGLIINVGEFSIMLAGDVENKTWKMIPEMDLPETIDFIKIPHHASESGLELVNKLKNMGVEAPEVVTTTVFRIHHLPDPDVIDVYKKWHPQLKVFSSGGVNSNQDTDRIGIIQVTFDVLHKKDIPIEISLTGNAVQL